MVTAAAAMLLIGGGAGIAARAVGKLLGASIA
jgi:hypothetical protein